MFVIFNNTVPAIAFKDQQSAIDWWSVNGGTIILYPDLENANVQCL